MRRTITALTAATVFAACAAAFAQAPTSEEAPSQMAGPQETMTAPAQPSAQAPSMGEDKKTDKPAKGSQTKGKAKAKGHAKKINKKQGDR